MRTRKEERRFRPAAVSGCARTGGIARLGIAGAAALTLLAAACGGAARPTNTTPERLSVNATVTPAAADSATPNTTDTTDTTDTATLTPDTAVPTPAADATVTGKKAAKREALANVHITADMVTRSFERHNLPVSQVQTITSQNDLDSQLGRANQYSSRADFLDTTMATASDWSLANGGVVEVFATTADAARAKKQLQASHGGTPPSEMDYQAGPIVLRLSPHLSAPLIATYEKVTKDTLKAAVKAAEGRKSGKKSMTATPTPTP